MARWRQEEGARQFSGGLGSAANVPGTFKVYDASSENRATIEMRSRLLSSLTGALRNLLQKPAGAKQTRSAGGLVPPESMIFVGNGDFEATGNEFLGYFVSLGGLATSSHVLDAGCGIGRMAVPLTKYLSSGSEYHGFDIVKTGIDWCVENISSRFANFHFTHADVYNKNYNPEGKTLAQDFRFPYEDGAFDFVFLTSVFTHMLPAAVDNYMSEISRVLKPGGTCLITFFLLNEESLRLVKAGKSTLDFKREIEGCLSISRHNPESAIAYKEDVVRALFKAKGLAIAEPIRYGSWCERAHALSYQDIVIAKK
jgi:SAM-dependent methyltransferase